MANLLLLFLLFLLLSAATLHLASATDHIVGAHLGWNPGVNYTPWINNQTFYVNDLISFRYPKNTYNVFEVNETGYDNCTTEGAAGNWTSGKDFIPLDQPQRYYFICSGFCFSGMKISVVVHPLPSPPPSSSAAGGHASNSTHSSASPLLCKHGGRGLAASVVAMLATLLVSI